MTKKTVLIAGASGLVGYAAAQYFSSLPEWNVIAVSRRRPAGFENVKFISVDLTDQKACSAIFSGMPEVTHVVYAALFEKPGLMAGWREDDQMATNDAMLRNLMEPLQAAATDLRHVSLLQGTKAYGAHIAPLQIPARERNPRHDHKNFYWLQEDYLRQAQQAADWHWTIFRPQIIFGESLGSAMNLIPALGVYGAILKAQGKPLYFPRCANLILEAVDADLLAHALAWAATTDTAANEIYNIANGDIFTWRNLWPTIADALGMEPGPEEPITFGSDMSKNADVWDKIRSDHNLISPDLETFVGESFHYADFTMGTGLAPDTPVPPALVSTVKLRQAGFGEAIDTEDMFQKWFRLFQEKRLLPPA